MLTVAFFALLAFALANGAWLMRRLETAHPAAWDALGRPDFALRSGAAPRLALVRYIWSQGFRRLGDAALSRSCMAAMVAEPLLAVLFVLLVGRQF